MGSTVCLIDKNVSVLFIFVVFVRISKVYLPPPLAGFDMMI